MVINPYFDTRQTNTPHPTLNYVPGKYKFEFDYYRHKYCPPGKVARNRKNWKTRSRSNVLL